MKDQEEATSSLHLSRADKIRQFHEIVNKNKGENPPPPSWGCKYIIVTGDDFSEFAEEWNSRGDPVD